MTEAEQESIAEEVAALRATVTPTLAPALFARFPSSAKTDLLPVLAAEGSQNNFVFSRSASKGIRKRVLFSNIV